MRKPCGRLYAANSGLIFARNQTCRAYPFEDNIGRRSGSSGSGAQTVRADLCLFSQFQKGIHHGCPSDTIGNFENAHSPINTETQSATNAHPYPHPIKRMETRAAEAPSERPRAKASHAPPIPAVRREYGRYVVMEPNRERSPPSPAKPNRWMDDPMPAGGEEQPTKIYSRGQGARP